MIIINIILFILLILTFLYVVNYKKHLTKINYDNIEKNKLLEKEKENLIKETSESKIKLENILQNINKYTDDQALALQNLFSIQEEIKKTQETAEETAQKAFENYHEVLQQAYKKVEAEYDNLEQECKVKLEAIQVELQKVQNTRKAAMEAAIREEEIKEKLNFYCLAPKSTDINDIKILERIKPQLNNPRILSMLIWSTYFQKDMTALCNKILGLKTITGIYKITNQENNKCYIGQSVDVAKRWKDHAKCGLGIDAPQGNKLYKEMQEIGIWNFSWELLEECSKEQLNEKEKFYIELYQSKDFGYNTTKGNNN